MWKLLPAVALLSVIDPILGDTCKNSGASITKRFSSSAVEHICFNEDSESNCASGTGSVNKNGRNFNCQSLNLGAERCGCTQADDFYADVTVLVDSTWGSTDVWKYVATYLPIYYYENMGTTANINLKWMYFSDEVEFIFSSEDGNPATWESVNSDWSRDEIPHALLNHVSGPDACEAIDTAMNDFELNGLHTNHILIYFGFNDANMGSCESRYDFGSNNFYSYGLRWSHKTDLSTIEDYFGDFDQCTAIQDASNYAWKVCSEMTSVSVLRYVVGSISDFICMESSENAPTKAPTQPPSKYHGPRYRKENHRSSE